MSTVTLSKPHCAIISAEKPEGIASHALTTALPDFQISLTLFATLPSFLLFWTLRPRGRGSLSPPKYHPARVASSAPAPIWTGSACGHFERKKPRMSTADASRTRISAFTPRLLPLRRRRVPRDFVRGG